MEQSRAVRLFVCVLSPVQVVVRAGRIRVEAEAGGVGSGWGCGHLRDELTDVL
ncbi:MAG: hypothetical protein AAFR75_11565 [Pseudomonadota bacterium]